MIVRVVNAIVKRSEAQFLCPQELGPALVQKLPGELTSPHSRGIGNVSNTVEGVYNKSVFSVDPRSSAQSS